MRQISIFRRKKQQNEIPLPPQETPRFDLPSFQQLAKKYDAVIHIGTPGTGSTAIQKFLADNHSRLAELGFYYPVPIHNNNNISYEHSKLGAYLKENDLVAAKSAFDNYLAEAKQHKLTLLLSEKSLYEYPDQLKEVTLEKKCKIIAFFREPLDAVYSNYNQAVKDDFSTITFKQFCHDIASSDNDRLSGKIFEKWQKSYWQQNLLVLGYDPSVFEQISIEKLFLAALGIDKNLFNTFQYTEQRVNPSHDFLALELRRWLNFIIDKELFYYTHNLDGLLQNYSEDNNETAKFFIQEHIPQELFLSLKDQFKETNNYLLKEILTPINPDFLIDDNSFDNTSTIGRNKYDDSELKNILEIILEKDETIKKYIINRTTKALSSNGGCYYVLRLADLLGIDVQPYIDTFSCMAENIESKPLFTNAQINNVFLSEKTQLADFLREIAVTMERYGDYKSAQLVIERALKLRPTGLAMIALRDRIKSKL